MGDTDMFGVAMNYLDEILEEGEEVGSIDALLSSFQHTKELVYSKKEEPVAAPGPPRSMREEQDRKDAIRQMVGNALAKRIEGAALLYDLSAEEKTMLAEKVRDGMNRILDAAITELAGEVRNAHIEDIENDLFDS